MSGIYKIENAVNGKTYVGSTKNSFSKRWGVHKCLLRNNKHENPHLQNAWNKYGEKSFRMEPLEEIQNASDLVLETRENYFMEKLKSEYNLVVADRRGPSFAGKHHTEETKHKLSIIAIGRPVSDETKKKISVAMKGKNHPLWGTHLSSETKEKIRQKHLGLPVSEITREKIRQKAIRQPRGDKRWNFSGKYLFFHSVHGEEHLGQCELVQKHKDLELDKSAVNKLCSSKLKQYKGWTCKGKVT